MRNFVHLYWMYRSAVARSAQTVSTVIQHLVLVIKNIEHPVKIVSYLLIEHAISLNEARAGTFELIETIVIRSIHQTCNNKMLKLPYQLSGISKKLSNEWS